MFIRVTRKVTIHRIAILLALSFAIADGAHAVQIGASAAGTHETSFSPLEPIVTAERAGMIGSRYVEATATSHLRDGSIEAWVRAESPSPLADCCSSVGVTAGNVLDDDILIGGGTPDVDFGTLTLTVTLAGYFDASTLDTPSLADHSWGRYGAQLLARRNSSSQASGEIDFDASGPDAFETDLIGVIEVTSIATLTGGTIEMVMTVTPGDVVDFRMTGTVAGWSGRQAGAFGEGALRQAVLDVALDGGLTWTSDSGALLTPEPDATTGALAAFGALAVSARRMRTA